MKHLILALTFSATLAACGGQTVTQPQPSAPPSKSAVVRQYEKDVVSNEAAHMCDHPDMRPVGFCPR